MLKYLLPALIIAAAAVPAAHTQQTAGLEKIRAEIAELEKKLKSSEAKEMSIQERLEDVNLQIGLRRRLLHKLERERSAGRKKIAGIEKDLARNRAEYEERKKLITRRFISMYKQGRQSDWEAVLSLKNANQFVVWMKYQRMIIENDKRNMRILQEQQETISRQQQQLLNELAKNEALIAEAAEEQQALQKNRAQEKELLAAVQQDKELIRKQIRTKQEAFARIKKLIESGEKNRSRAAYEEVSADFKKLKGTMNWPAAGPVVSRYGKFRNAAFKVDEENYGLDIEAAPESPVRAVCRGRVITVDWLRGMGNIVIMDHGNGYNTVYGHLNLVLVNTGELIEAGTEIGRVGSSSSLYGTKLHFQIWHLTDHQNPLGWLKKQ